jgi:hypothetical protein
LYSSLARLSTTLVAEEELPRWIRAYIKHHSKKISYLPAEKASKLLCLFFKEGNEFEAPPSRMAGPRWRFPQPWITWSVDNQLFAWGQYHSPEGFVG